jgi:hypothetical protein
MSNALAREIEKMLAPVLGEDIAKAAVARQCELIGTTADELKPEHLLKLSENLEKAIIIFAGKEAAEMIKKQVKGT